MADPEGGAAGAPPPLVQGLKNQENDRTRMSRLRLPRTPLEDISASSGVCTYLKNVQNVQ